MLLLFTLLTFIILPNKTNAYSVKDFKYSSCGISSDIAQNIVLDISPDLPEIDYTLYLNADFNKEVTSGTSKYSITYNFIPLSPTVNNLCEEISKSNITCPLSGHISSESKGTIPIDLRGTTVIKNEWFTDNQERILCMTFTIKT